MSGLPLDSHIMSRYEIIAELARGGMARVYLAALRGTAGFQKLVVVKRLRGDLALEDADANAMFVNEARLTGRMHHPNIAETLEVGQSDAQIFLVMEFLDGQPLHAVLRRACQTPGGWPLAFQLAILTEVLAGLHYAHELRDYDGGPLGIVHRDVSPQNVFVTYDGAVKIVDFGVAKAAVSDVRTRHGVLKGKIAYMAPEHASGGVVDRRADVFAVGVMLYEALSGVRMWQGHTEIEIFRDLAMARIPEVQAAPGVPDRLRAICSKALAPDPDRRYATAADLQADIEEWLASSALRVSPKAIGRAVASLFGVERQKVRGAIDSYMRGATRELSSAVETDSASLASPRSSPTQTLMSVTPPAVAAAPVPAAFSGPSRRAAVVSGRAAVGTCVCLVLGFAFLAASRRGAGDPAGSSGPTTDARGSVLSSDVAVAWSVPTSSGATGMPACSPPRPPETVKVTVTEDSISTGRPSSSRAGAEAVRSSNASRWAPSAEKRAGAREFTSPAEPDRRQSLGQSRMTLPAWERSSVRSSSRPAKAVAEESSSRSDATEFPHFGDPLPSEPASRRVRPIDTADPFVP